MEVELDLWSSRSNDAVDHILSDVDCCDVPDVDEFILSCSSSGSDLSAKNDLSSSLAVHNHHHLSHLNLNQHLNLNLSMGLGQHHMGHLSHHAHQPSHQHHHQLLDQTEAQQQHPHPASASPAEVDDCCDDLTSHQLAALIEPSLHPHPHQHPLPGQPGQQRHQPGQASAQQPLAMQHQVSYSGVSSAQGYHMFALAQGRPTPSSTTLGFEQRAHSEQLAPDSMAAMEHQLLVGGPQAEANRLSGEQQVASSDASPAKPFELACSSVSSSAQAQVSSSTTNTTTAAQNRPLGQQQLHLLLSSQPQALPADEQAPASTPAPSKPRAAATKRRQSAATAVAGPKRARGTVDTKSVVSSTGQPASKPASSSRSETGAEQAPKGRASRAKRAPAKAKVTAKPAEGASSSLPTASSGTQAEPKPELQPGTDRAPEGASTEAQASRSNQISSSCSQPAKVAARPEEQPAGSDAAQKKPDKPSGDASAGDKKPQLRLVQAEEGNKGESK